MNARITLPIAAAALLALTLSGCASDPAGVDLASAATSSPTKTATPTPTPTARTTVYTTASGQAVQVSSAGELPDAVRADVMAQYQHFADVAKSGVHGQYVQASNEMSKGADAVALRTGRPTAFFYAGGGSVDGLLVYTATGSGDWPLQVTKDRAKGLGDTQNLAGQFGYDVYVFG